MGNKRFYIFLLVGKIALIWCLVIFTASYITSNTTAHFTDKLQVSDEGTIGVWEKDSEELESPEEEAWDQHALQFISKQPQNLNSCEPTVIKAKLKNTSDIPMPETTSYDVYYIENGNPQNKHGKKLKLPESEGIIYALKSGETTTLTFAATTPGSYMFRIGSPDKEGIWSEKIMVKCNQNKNTKSNENTAKKLEKAVEKQQQEPEQINEESKVNTEKKAEVNEQLSVDDDAEVETKEEGIPKEEVNDSANENEEDKD